MNDSTHAIKIALAILLTEEYEQRTVHISREEIDQLRKTPSKLMVDLDVTGDVEGGFTVQLQYKDNLVPFKRG